MPQNLGFSYQPGATRDISAKGTATGGSGSTPQGPAKLLTYRIPKSPLGQSPIAPRSLLESPGGAGAGRGLDSLVAALMGTVKPQGGSAPGVVGPPDNVVGKPTPIHPGPSTPTPVFGIPPQPGRPRPMPIPLPPLAPQPDGDVGATPPLFDFPKPGPVNGTPPIQPEVPLRPSPGTPPHIGFTPDPPQGPPPPAEQQPAPPPEPEPVRSPIPDYKRDTLPETFDLAPLPSGNDTQSLFSEPMDWHALKRLMAGGDY